MNMEFSKKEEVAILEKNEKSRISTMEAEKSDQEFASEILSRIENEINSESSSQVEVQKIEDSISLINLATNEEIKKELDLENKLGDLDTEAKNVGEEAKSKISEITGFSKAYHHPEYRKNIAKQILEARKTGKNAEKIRTDFYEKTTSEKESFELQEKERSIAEIMKEKDLVVVHGMLMPELNPHTLRGSDFNNKVLNNTRKDIGFEDTYNVIAGLSPTISASIPSPDRPNNGLAFRHGVILAEGQILSAKKEDSGSVAFSLYKRIPKYGNEDHKHSAIQPNIDIESIVPSAGQNSSTWNELTVEKPKIAGLFQDLSINNEYYNINNPKSKWKVIFPDRQESEILEEIEKEKAERKEELNKELFRMKEYSEKLKIPLYAFKNEEGELKKYKVEFTEGKHKDSYLKKIKYGFTDDNIPSEEKELIWSYNLLPTTALEIHNKQTEVSKDEKNQIIQSLKDKKVFSQN